LYAIRGVIISRNTGDHSLRLKHEAIAGFMAMLDDLRAQAQTALPEEVLEAVLRRARYLAEIEESIDPQDAGRVENRKSWSASPASTERAEAAIVATAWPPPRRRRSLRRHPASPASEQVSLVTTPTSTLRRPDHQGVVTLMTLHRQGLSSRWCS
jgi:DNA helicase-2/ATP-dependent DNA helicase PcrA